MTPDWAFLLPAIPICLWVIYSDLSAMRIPNLAVLALIGVFAAIGPFVLPLAEFGWRWLHLVVVIAVLLIGAVAGHVGMGDVKFAGAMALFVRREDIVGFFWLLCIVVIVSFLLHRTLRRMPALRPGLSGWRSWEHPRFPMGVPLAASLLIYLAL